jgi:hypothetical protein
VENSSWFFSLDLLEIKELSLDGHCGLPQLMHLQQQLSSSLLLLTHHTTGYLLSAPALHRHSHRLPVLQPHLKLWSDITYYQIAKSESWGVILACGTPKSARFSEHHGSASGPP